MATAQGAGLILVQVMVGLCGDSRAARGAFAALLEFARGDLTLGLIAATAHIVVMVLSGGEIAWLVYRYVGLKLLGRSWLNLDLLWAAPLIVVGGIALVPTLGVSRKDLG